MNRNVVKCDGNGCDCERDASADSRAWLRLMVVGGHPHEVFDFCPSCAGAFRALMPRGPEPKPPLELEPPATEPPPELEPVNVVEGDEAPSTERHK